MYNVRQGGAGGSPGTIKRKDESCGKEKVMTIAELLELEKSKKTKVKSHEEDDLQKECVRVFNLMFPKSSQALVHIPNEGKRKTKLITINGVSRVICTEGNKLKQMGLRRGVSDLILFEKRGEYGALHIELKTKKGSQSSEQKEWQKIVEEKGYKYVLCRNVEQFINEVKKYLSWT